MEKMKTLLRYLRLLFESVLRKQSEDLSSGKKVRSSANFRILKKKGRRFFYQTEFWLRVKDDSFSCVFIIACEILLFSILNQL